MTDAELLIVGAVLIDDLLFADGTRQENVPGGAGLYALAGAAIFDAKPVLLTGTGRDFSQTFGPWMERNGLGTHGLRFADDRSPRNVLKYHTDGGRTETPVFGLDHFARIEPRPDDIARFSQSARAIYVFRNTDAFWDGFRQIEFAERPLVLWEIALDACYPENLPRIEAILANVDALSINLDEARGIFATDDEEDVLRRLAEWPVRAVFLRAGARGSYVLCAGKTTFVPSLPVEAVDVTGGGNAFGGGALAGLAQGLSARDAAIMGTVAASFAVSQYGPPETSDPTLRTMARQQVQALISQFEESAA